MKNPDKPKQKMKPAIKELWVAALESGDYVKTTNRLKFGQCYCINGVLCDLYLQENTLTWKSKPIDYNCQYKDLAYLPFEVLLWSGLTSVDSIALARLNDQGGKSFIELVEYIQTNL